MSSLVRVAPSTSSLPSTEGVGRGSELQQQSLHAASIDILDDDSLLTVFYLYRPAIFDIDDDDNIRDRGGKTWTREKWWYKLTGVCRRWRNLIFGSASHLGLCLVCTSSTRIEGVLAHSPPLPLIIDYEGESENMEMTAADDEQLALALVQRDRVRRIRLCLPTPRLRRLLMAMDGEYPILEYLIMDPLKDNYKDALILPETLQIPHLHHLMLIGFAPPIRPQLLTTALGLVKLHMDFPFGFLPTVLLVSLSSMPQLETLDIGYSRSHRDYWAKLERQHMHILPTPTQIILPNLRRFGFRGTDALLEEFVPLITTPSLEKLDIFFYSNGHTTFPVPNLLQFMNTTNLSFSRAEFKFSKEVVAVLYPHEAKMHALSISVDSSRWDLINRGLNWQIIPMANIFDSLSQIFSTVEHLTLGDLAENHDDFRECVDLHYRQWRKLFRSFGNVKTLCIDHRLLGGLSCGGVRGEFPLDTLPELQELTFTVSGDVGDAFASFINARQNADRPVTLAHSPVSSVVIIF